VPVAVDPLLLAVDVGNSHTTCGLFRQGELLDQFRLRSEPRLTADELAAACRAQLALRGLDGAAVTGLALGSVVPALEKHWREFTARHCPGLAQAPLVVDHTLDCGLTLAIEQPESLGADRLINAAMSWQDHHRACIAVDVGTALTLDCVSNRGEFTGGVILPGPALGLSALVEGTALLPSVDLAMPLTGTMGKNTREAIRAGVLVGWGGMIDRLVERLRTELVSNDKPPHVVATGGMAGLLAPYCERLAEIDPHLTLRGLAWLHQRHCAP